LTIDVEDWFQVENFKQYIPFTSWSSYQLRVEKNTHRLLDLLDSIKLHPSAVPDPCNVELISPRLNCKTSPSAASNEQQCSDYQLSAKSHKLGCQRNPKATFFVLVWIAERLPHLVREIHARGHEVASHGYYHRLCKEELAEGLKQDLADSKKLLEDIIGDRVYGYRAPSFSMNPDILKIIEECGYLYDSSFNSFRVHRRYGQIDLSQNIKNGIAVKISDTLYELPISNIRLGNRTLLPWGGGGYFRLMPLSLFRRGVQSILKKEKTYLFYFHPWEIDPEQPRVNQASMLYKFRHYINLNKTYSKLCKLLETFNQCHFPTCHQYLSGIIKGVF
jgi:polysaccharide deacetylase family protein (PEP-CTERM system associated)